MAIRLFHSLSPTPFLLIFMFKWCTCFIFTVSLLFLLPDKIAHSHPFYIWLPLWYTLFNDLVKNNSLISTVFFLFQA
ncbi:hypothetical protein BD560DRAFT_396061 [Blakeslea trispora]|nr:hypothetical protein BD560DRAFT_396061 [Blakeslea trispora]